MDMTPDLLQRSRPTALPPSVGIGLKPQHYEALLDPDSPSGKPAWVEVHPQNYFGAPDSWGGGPPHRWLTAIAELYPLSFHSVGLSLGSADGLNRHDLDRLAILCDRYDPASVSDHLSFSGNAHNRFADLLPVPYTKASLDHFSGEIGKVQDRLKRQILIENPSRYLAYRGDEMSEVEFIERLVSKSGCGLLFDINNVEVSATNLGFSAQAYVDAIDPDWVGEIHLAGHAVEQHGSGPLLIDDHGSRVTDATWSLYRRFIECAGAKPTLIEWDTDVPDYVVLMTEAGKAAHILNPPRHGEVAARRADGGGPTPCATPKAPSTTELCSAVPLPVPGRN
jgi:uncharacterized protein